MNNLQFRNYHNSMHQDRVEKTYRDMIQNQTLEYVLDVKAHFIKNPNIKKDIWEVFDMLDKIVDDSDPDTNASQMIHAYQTARTIQEYYLRRNGNKLKKTIVVKDLFTEDEWMYIPEHVKKSYKTYLHEQYQYMKTWDWLVLVGFIHDLGKVLVLPEFGALPQWSVVGDTFPVGCRFSRKNIFYHKGFHKDNTDYKRYNTYGIYKNNCGFNRIHMSYGHDEYLASVLEINNTKLPKEAIYIIRFHSFYVWHSPKNSNIRGYTHLANDYDWRMLPLLKAFQKADLYSKSTSTDIKQIKKSFLSLIKKYIGKDKIIW